MTLTDSFWAPKLEINRRVTIPHIMRENETTGRVDNFRKAARQMPGAYTGRRFNDTDIYKIVEAASLSLKAKPDPVLDKKVDDLIALIAASQEPDGYLFPARTIDPKNPAAGVGPERWIYENGSHELYNAGHLYEAAVAHFQSTGKTHAPRRRDQERRSRRGHVRSVRPACRARARGHRSRAREDVPGHRQPQVSRHREVLHRRARQAASRTCRTIRRERSRCTTSGPTSRTRSRSSIRRARSVTRSARSTSIWARPTSRRSPPTPGYTAALDRLWDDMASKRMYLTGGIGARGTTESFGEDYELPNRRAYTETCASVGNLLWGHRMFLLHGDAKYLDVLEQVLYNGYLSGVSLSGDRFFYQNPLESAGRTDRSAYFDVACCPANLSRLMEQVPGLLYSTRGNDVFVNLYAANTRHDEDARPATSGCARRRDIRGTAPSRVTVDVPTAARLRDQPARAARGPAPAIPGRPVPLRPGARSRPSS